MTQRETMTAEINELYGVTDENGNVVVLHRCDGSAATRIDANVYPVGSEFGTRYEHPEGIVITRADAEKIGLEVERFDG